MSNFIEIKHFFEKLQNEIETDRNKKFLKKTIILQTEKNNRMFGYYKCSICDNQWTSAYSWEDKWQKCRRCKKLIYAYNQEKLIKSIHQKLFKSHDRSSCQVCIESGIGCNL